jgi:glutamate-1-semialdehyde aminotransferase
MGKGCPVAGSAVAPEIVAEFGRDTRYFNTFGGNTVAIAAAQATLDVIRDERLLENAEKVGQLMRDGLKGIAARYERIGDVRGAGLYIGVEMDAMPIPSPRRCGKRDGGRPSGATRVDLNHGIQCEHVEDSSAADLLGRERSPLADGVRDGCEVTRPPKTKQLG